MTSSNGRKPPPDPDLLTPNDWRRLRVAMGGQNPREKLVELEDMMQLLILAYKLRDDPEFTWEQAGDVPPATVLGTFAEDGQSPPDPSPVSPAGTSGGSRSSRSAKPSGRKRRDTASASSSATTTG